MTDDQIRTILAALGVLQVGQARLEEKVDRLKTDSNRGDLAHSDHEQRIRALEVAKGEVDGVGLERRVRALELGESEGRGMWKLLTAGGIAGALLATIGAAVARSLGL